MRYVGEGKPLDRESALSLFQNIFKAYGEDPAFFVWAVIEDGEYVGHAELKRRRGRDEYELIYILHRSRWGQSLGGQLTDLLLSEARKRHLPFVIATVNDRNAASLAILKRRDFVVDERLSAELACAAYRLDLAEDR